jgi:MazG family protein
LEAAAQAFKELCVTIASLRDPKTGCPWDLEQDHGTLRRYMIEEAYEASEAMATGEKTEICDELGDVLLQVVLNAQVAQDAKHFSIVDVIRAIDAKMLRRHPHVFGTEAERGQHATSGAVHATWDKLKAKEKPKASSGAAAAAAARESVFAGTQKKHPASAQAVAIGKRAATIKFDWDKPEEVLAQVASEVRELEAELKRPERDQAAVAAEVGDLYFSLAQLCRHLGLDPEVAAADGNRKFLRRFSKLEDVAERRGIAVREATRDQLEELWKAAKDAER